MLCLIIFLWTPPHFWALALYRTEDYRARRPADAAGHARRRVHAPARPAVHAGAVRRHAAAVRLRHERLALPGRGGRAGRRFIGYAWRLWRSYSDALARKTFRFSIWHLSLLFAALLVDHYLGPLIAMSLADRCACSAGGAAVLARAGCDRLGAPAPKASFKAIDITGADYARKLELPDADGKPRTLAEFKGKVVVVFFGYTQCPDVCPTTHGRAGAGAASALGADGDKLQGVFVTVDPERDTPRGAEGLRRQLRRRLRRAARHARADARGGARSSRCSTPRCRARRAAATRSTTRPARYVFDTQGRVRLFVPLRRRRRRRWQTTSARCCERSA